MRRWLAPLVVAGLAYATIGIGIASLTPTGASGRAFRWAAWILSAIVFAAHITSEQRRHDHPRLQITALRAAAAAALGAFLLAASANIHRHPASTDSRLVLALAIWPAATMIAAFPVALMLAAVVRKR